MNFREQDWYKQAKIFFKEIQDTREQEENESEEKVIIEDMEYISSASEARLLSAPRGSSFLIFCTFILLIGLFGWSIIMDVDEVVKAQGKVIPSKQVQVIQNLEGGIIKEINIVEGQSVRAGDTLLLIDDVYAKSDLEENVNGYNALLARLVALDTLIEGRRILNVPKELIEKTNIVENARKRFNAQWQENMENIVQIEHETVEAKNQLTSEQDKLEIAKDDYEIGKEEFELNKKAFEKGLISKVSFLKLKHQLNDNKTKYNNYKNNIPILRGKFDQSAQKRKIYLAKTKTEYEKEYEEIKVKLDTMQSKGVSLVAKVSHSIVKSPVDGTIKKINFNTVGGVIRPGMDIMEIIPTDDKLIIELKLKPKDIGFIDKGLQAKIQLTAFDFSTYGGLEGKVIFVSADTITDPKGNSFFLVRVETTTNYIVDKKGIERIIIPGMQTQANIVVDKKSIFAYILKPMLK